MPLFRLFALTLDLRVDCRDWLTTHLGGMGRLLHCPEQPPAAADVNKEVEGKSGLGAHTYCKCSTLLLADENPGLEIRERPVHWLIISSCDTLCPLRPVTRTVNVA